MLERKKKWPWMVDFHALVVRDVMFWCCFSNIEKIRRVLESRTLAYAELGILDEPYNDVFFADAWCRRQRSGRHSRKSGWLSWGRRIHPVLTTGRRPGTHCRTEEGEEGDVEVVEDADVEFYNG